jgi:hypothetical protein
MSRWVKALKIGEEKGPWTEAEDAVIRAAVQAAGGNPANVCWAEVVLKVPGRLGKQCRERWQNRLDPNISKKPFEPEVSGKERRAPFVFAAAVAGVAVFPRPPP